MKRVLFVESYPHVMMGQQKTLTKLLDRCKDRNIYPIVACTDEGVFSQYVRNEGFETLIIPYPDKINVYGGQIYHYSLVDKLKTYFQVIEYIFSLIKFLKTNKIDTVYCNDMRGLLTVGVAAKLCFIPVVIWDKLNKPHGWLDKLQLPLVSKNIIISDSITTKYPTIQTKIFSAKIHKIMEGVFLDEFSNYDSIRSEFGCHSSDIVLAIVGSISERKGHDRIFDIFPDLVKSNPNIKLWVVGDADENPKDQSFLQSLPNKDHPNITFLGYRNDLSNVMNSIDILVVPSRFEGLGMVILEAMASKKVVVGSKCGGIPEVIQDGKTGYLFDGNSSAALKNILLNLSANDSLRQSMGAEGYNRAFKYFNRNSQLNKVLDLLRIA